MTCEDGGQIELDDGRRLSFREYGDSEGEPLFYFHGFPGSRLEAAFAADMLQRNGIRLIAVERPGYGLSDPLPERRMLDWSSDVLALADTLRLDKFAILGVSVGGCYALACASAIPARITRIGIAGALAPLQETGLLSEMSLLSRYCFAASRHDSRLSRWVYGRLLGRLIRYAPGMFLGMLRRFSRRADRETLLDPEFALAVKFSMREAYRQGWTGPYQDLVQVAGEWGFTLQDITVPVYLWHGEEDNTVPPSMGRYLAQQLPVCRARFLSGEGHFSMTRNFMQEAVLILSGQMSSSPVSGYSVANHADIPDEGGVVSC